MALDALGRQIHNPVVAATQLDQILQQLVRGQRLRAADDDELGPCAGQRDVDPALVFEQIADDTIGVAAYATHEDDFFVAPLEFVGCVQLYGLAAVLAAVECLEGGLEKRELAAVECHNAYVGGGDAGVEENSYADSSAGPSRSVFRKMTLDSGNKARESQHVGSSGPGQARWKGVNTDVERW